MPDDGYVHVRGARVHNLKNVDVRIPRDALVVFTGVSGSRQVVAGLRHPLRRGAAPVPRIRRALRAAALPPDGRARGRRDRRPPPGRCPPAAARRADHALLGRKRHHAVEPPSHALLPRGRLPAAARAILYAESFSPNTVEGACPRCHGLGRIYDVTERSMVPGRLAHHPRARDRLVAAGVARPEPARHPRHPGLRRGPALARAAEEGPRLDPVHRGEPTVPVYAGYTPAETRRALKRKEEPSYMGTFTGARKYVLETFAKTESASMKKRVSRYMVSTECPDVPRQAASAGSAAGEVRGARHRRHVAAAAQAAGGDLRGRRRRARRAGGRSWNRSIRRRRWSRCRIARDLIARLDVLMDLGLGYLSLERSTPTLSPGELQRLRLGTQVAQQPVRRGLRAGRAVGRTCTRRTPSHCFGRSTG